jgi:cathepsin A (carboxypeptidase C)
MKLTAFVAASLLAGANAFSIQQTLANENLLAKAADALNIPMDSLTQDVKTLWSDMTLKFPDAVSNLQFWSHPKKFTKKAKWDFRVQNEALPNHTLRVKKNDPKVLGIDTVKQYSGYLDVTDEDKHFFYYFFESRNDPKNDPIVLWLNGGPGCSSLTGLFFELGPSSIGEDVKPKYNPYSWNSNASVIFLDQPVNVGYSYSSSSVTDTVAAGKDVYAFLELFFQQFPEYKDVKFHIAGESYAGHYIPVFATEILSHEERGFNLSSVLIGNGLTDPLTQYKYYEPMACGEGGAPSVLPEDQCQNMLDTQDRCLSLIESCYESESVWSCVPAAIYCNNAQIGPYQKSGRNVYDIRGECEGGPLCYTGLDYIDEYLNKEEVKEALGAEVDSYEGCNFDVNRNFLFAGDWMKPYHKAVTTLLEADLPVLIYAGDKDFICNWLGNEAWSNVLPWSETEGFSSAKTKSWKVDGEEAGTVKNHKNFSFLRIYEAGHMVPYDQPENSLDFFNEWIGSNFGIRH